MGKLSKNKTIILIVAAAVLAAVLLVGGLIFWMSRKGNTGKSLSLGNNYLSNLDYASAIEQFGKVLSVDPLNEDAMIGMAVSYAGMGDVNMAHQIMNGELTDSKNTEILRLYGEILEDKEKYAEELRVIRQIIGQKDLDEDYVWYEDVMKKLMKDRTYSYSEAKENVIAINGDRVQTAGSNVLGALGTERNLGTETVTSTLADAGFNGKAVSVFTTGTSSVVLDDKGTIWTAGSNRSGQHAVGSSTLIAEAGWKQDTTLSDVVKIAGGNGTIFALTADGTLYAAGSNGGFVKGSAWLPEWTPVTRYGDVIDLQCFVDRTDLVAILTADGRLFTIDTGDSYYGADIASTRWKSVAENVKCFSLSSNGSITCVNTAGKIEVLSNYSGLTLPDSWYEYDESTGAAAYMPPFEIASLALLQDSMYLLDTEGKLYFVKNAAVSEVAVGSPVDQIYSSGNSCVIQFENGSYQLYNETGREK